MIEDTSRPTFRRRSFWHECLKPRLLSGPFVMSDTPKDAKGIFLAALDIQDPAERATFVARSCQGDDPLRKRVEELLRAYGESGGPLDKLAAALAPTRLGEPIREQVGSTIGPYRLMEQIGEGGFGLVFVAEQQQPIRRKVALKIIKPGMDTRDVIARFEAERQALALMDHPNIARVLDAGTTESGRPYFVMELVRGVPITEYCDQNQLTPRERLELFVPVCNAIQHAHLKGIIHRDVKPSNVLVTMHDAKPVVKVIDFGVAKALHQQLTDRTIYTRFAQMIGTPLYMSPEQAQMSGLDIDTRSDIYSLGVLLYELLTGSTPLNKERLAKAAYDELLKIIREEEPPKPSVRLSQSTDTLPSIAAQRKTEPAKLSKMFHGDLDWIAMKALEKDRTRRYETANAFAADVSRYLNDEPVEASPPSTAYRIRKFARKHRGPVIALAMIAAVLVLGIAGTTWGLFRARQAEQAADASKREVIGALKQTTRERDAKEVALKSETAQRDRAEREFANGLLRPIAAADEISPAELRSFYDWVAIPETSLKLRVLEIALDDPDRAMQLTGRVETVVQSCVGLSPVRRARAIELVSAKQRDMTVDPRIRVAACWLGLELGSTDLPAWRQSCKYLCDPKNAVQAEQISAFVAMAASRSDLAQAAQLNPEPLIAVLETSRDPNVLVAIGNSWEGFLARLDNDQVARTYNALLHHMATATPADINDWVTNEVTVKFMATSVLIKLKSRMQPAQLRRAVDILITVLANDAQLSATALGGLTPHLEPAQCAALTEALVAAIGKSQDMLFLQIRDATSPGSDLLSLVQQLTQKQIARVTEAIISSFEKGYRGESLDRLFNVMIPRMDDRQVTRMADALLFRPDRSKLPSAKAMAKLVPRMQTPQVNHLLALSLSMLDERASIGKEMSSLPMIDEDEASSVDKARKCLSVLAVLSSRMQPEDVRGVTERLILKLPESPAFAASGLAALAPRLQQEQAVRVWDALIQTVPEETQVNVAIAFDSVQRVDRAVDALQVTALRLPPAQIQKEATKFINTLSRSGSSKRGQRAAEGLLALIPRLEAPAVKDSVDALIKALEHPADRQVVIATCSGLGKLVMKLDSDQISRLSDALVATLARRNDPEWREAQAAGQLFSGLASQLDPTHIRRGADALRSLLRSSPDPNLLHTLNRWVPGLAPFVQTAEADRIGEALIPVLRRSSVNNSRNLLGDALIALLPRLNLALQDKLTTEAAVAALDAPTSENADWILPMSSSRSLVGLLSHLGCVGDKREQLLKRFDELTFNNATSAVSNGTSRERSSGPKNKDAAADAAVIQLPRHFRNQWDAAAWIQQNWPDFDLETPCPATWRGSR
jgi:serine/threonine protein kinase